GLGIRDDPAVHERDQAMEIFKETVEFENGRYIVQLPFRKSYNELSDNYSLAKQRFQGLWRRFGHDSELYQQYREIILDYSEQELLDRSFYVDDLISGGNEFEEALQTSRRAKYVMEAAGMDLRKWITNDTNLMEQWKKENFDVHPVHETVSLGANETKVLGLSWNSHEDYLTTDTKSLLEFVSLDKNTKRFILQAVGKIFDPLGLISPFTVRMKCLLQDLWKEEIQWDDPLPTHIEKEWKKWREELPHLGKGLGIRDDPAVHERDQAMEIFKETVEFENGRYIVQLPFRKSYNELSDNYSLAKQRFQGLWRRFGHDSELYQQYREIILDYSEQELLDRSFYVDDLISGGNEFEEALQTSRRAKYVMEAAGMDLRKWITNDTNLMEQWKKENFDVHPVHETVSLGANETKVLGLSWNSHEDYLTTDTKSLLEFVSLDKNTKRFILQAVGKIFDPLGLISPFTVRMKCLLQDLWKEEIQWD
ncbi:uncharacterized protein NPIL_407191, partial [Nephila pilipes]